MALWNRFFGSAVSNAAGYGVGGAIQPTLEPLTQDLANDTWTLHPSRPLPASLAAAAVIAGQWDKPRGQLEALKSGVNAERFDALLVQSANAPGIVELFDLWRRGEIDADTFERGLEQGNIRAEWRTRLRRLKNVLPSVTDMVRFGVREVYTPDIAERFGQFDDFPEAFADDAENLGISRERARQYWAAHWELPSPEQGFEMLHRNIIEQPDLERLMRALDVMPFWRRKLIQLARRIPPLTDMIRFAVREVYSPAVRDALGLDDDYPPEFTAEAALHGMNETRAKQYWAAHWRLPSATQGFDMLHRGEINEAGLRTLLRALDYPPFWRAKLQNIAYRLPGRIDLRRMLQFGVIDRAGVKRGYQKLGYTDADAETLTKFAEALVESSTAGTDAVSPRVRAAQTQAITEIRSGYLIGNVDETQARGWLSDVDVETDVQDGLIKVWNVQREIPQKGLSAAQIKKASRSLPLLWPRARALDELMQLGLTADDAATLLDE